MPQMMPINWMLSFFFIICAFMMFNIMNYYIFNMKLMNMNKNKNKNKNSFKNFYWKW